MKMSMEETIAGLSTHGAVTYHYGKFPPEALNYNILYKKIASATAAIARFDQMLETMQSSEVLLAPLRRQEAVISSRMEGTVSTIDEILQYEADFDEGEPIDPNVREDIIETFLYQRSLTAGQLAIEGGVPFNAWLVRKLHEELLSFGRGAKKSPGQYKIVQNYLVDNISKKIKFVPITPERLDDGMNKLFKFMHDSEEEILLKTSLSHIEFEALHPFEDGNGRVGRMLITLMLWYNKIISKPHFYISGYLEENKDEYIERMRRVSSHDEWAQWCLFFLTMLEQQALRNLALAQKISLLYENMKGQFSQALSSKWSIQAQDYVFKNPIFRNTKFIANSNVPTPSARKFAKLLEKNGLIREIRPASGPQSAIYAFEPLLEIVRV